MLPLKHMAAFFFIFFAKKETKTKLCGVFLLAFFLIFGAMSAISARAEEAANLQDDFELYQKYELYLKYEKKQKYQDYKKYKKYKEKYGFENQKEKFDSKDKYLKYKLYRKDPAKYRHYAAYEKECKQYSKYKKYVAPYKKYSGRGKYKKYDKKEYDDGKNYGGNEYKDGWQRYRAAQSGISNAVGETDLGCGPKNSGGACLGPEITVGLHSYSKNQFSEDSFRVESAINALTGQKIAYAIKNANGDVLAAISSESPSTKIKLNNKSFRIYGSVDPEITASGEIYFDAADASDTEHIVFDTNVPIASYDRYRGKIKIRYCNASSGYCDAANSDRTNDRVWIINILPLEQYAWGMGELNLANVIEHNRAMLSIYRTYGYWKIKFGTKYANQGFKVTATSSSQIYRGYNYETSRPAIVQAAKDTWGKIIRYGGQIALSPYSSWTDGRTRSFEERWGSKDYPWCQSVSDPYGKHPSMSTSELENAGNHMVGLSANGSVKLANDHGKNWEWILGYYFKNINIHKAY